MIGFSALCRLVCTVIAIFGLCGCMSKTQMEAIHQASDLVDDYQWMSTHLPASPQDLALLDQTIKADPKNGKAYFRRGLSYRLMKGKSKEALADFDNAVSIDPKNAFWLSVRAQTKGASDDHVGALADYDRVLSLSPNLATAWTGKGVEEAALGHTDKAEDYLRQGIECDRNGIDGASYAARARFLAERGELKRASSDYLQAVQQCREKATEAEYLVQLIPLLAKTGQTQLTHDSLLRLSGIDNQQADQLLKDPMIKKCMTQTKWYRKASKKRN